MPTAAPDFADALTYAAWNLGGGKAGKKARSAADATFFRAVDPREQFAETADGSELVLACQVCGGETRLTALETLLKEDFKREHVCVPGLRLLGSMIKDHMAAEQDEGPHHLPKIRRVDVEALIDFLNALQQENKWWGVAVSYGINGDDVEVVLRIPPGTYPWAPAGAAVTLRGVKSRLSGFIKSCSLSFSNASSSREESVSWRSSKDKSSTLLPRPKTTAATPARHAGAGFRPKRSSFRR